MAKRNWVDGIDDMEEEERQGRFREDSEEDLEDDFVETDTEDSGEREISEIKENLKVVTPEEGDGPLTVVDQLRSENESLKNDLALARADLYNYRQRVERERIQKMKLISEDRAAEFIPVLDNLDRALLVPGETSVKDVLTGVRMVQRQFLSVLENAGITVIPTEGCAFDPQWHNAVETEIVDDPEQDGMVLQELTRGYQTPNRAVRAAHVRVGKLKGDEIDDGTE
ncbi:MAG: nucleotide exchange factor GrpE [Synergistaceae bacterium]|jgi:molecular chaperone GrpE|nr:nucleotide exchange factor GrpE [Synergistaceae bacterium]